jgi:hypothetical protein
MVAWDSGEVKVEAERLWADWDALTEEQRKLLGPSRAPKVPRPRYDT